MKQRQSRSVRERHSARGRGTRGIPRLKVLGDQLAGRFRRAVADLAKMSKVEKVGTRTPPTCSEVRSWGARYGPADHRRSPERQLREGHRKLGGNLRTQVSSSISAPCSAGQSSLPTGARLPSDNREH